MTPYQTTALDPPLIAISSNLVATDQDLQPIILSLMVRKRPISHVMENGYLIRRCRWRRVDMMGFPKGHLYSISIIHTKSGVRAPKISSILDITLNSPLAWSLPSYYFCLIFRRQPLRLSLSLIRPAWEDLIRPSGGISPEVANPPKVRLASPHWPALLRLNQVNLLFLAQRFMPS
ncbi:hypothetical protein L228DRAFT_106174 [Xylona heveae TC161]|uniref:Uncharacterized protein n=1 Tax=Xylona heveae (strain CBS 132557 / TC161) TaxID=1328760 RepID=A0A165HA80_XYLHT|nr:hypothetical protein L228DRAFT_106174 [Xylona heveae TC161]KZF23203.1 hypothetical protein L228DRAFT_106174 [Xylona heveae TC161]